MNADHLLVVRAPGRGNPRQLTPPVTSKNRTFPPITGHPHSDSDTRERLAGSQSSRTPAASAARANAVWTASATATWSVLTVLMNAR